MFAAQWSCFCYSVCMAQDSIPEKIYLCCVCLRIIIPNTEFTSMVIPLLQNWFSSVLVSNQFHMCAVEATTFPSVWCGVLKNFQTLKTVSGISWACPHMCFSGGFCITVLRRLAFREFFSCLQFGWFSCSLNLFPIKSLKRIYFELSSGKFSLPTWCIHMTYFTCEIQLIR